LKSEKAVDNADVPAFTDTAEKFYKLADNG
jgi:hypothetical protein